MKRYKLKNGFRRKAQFGTQEAAILAAAGINVAGTLSAAAINSAAAKEAAKQQADSINQAAKQQAESIKLQNENNTQLQENSIEFTKEQNEENRDLQKEIQTNLQILAGKQNANDKLEAAKIQVRNGGSMKQKQQQINPFTLLRGVNNGNIPFQVTDGGSVIPVGVTPQGFNMYELIGNDHEHYHKTKGGKHKTGVGIKFATGNVIEGEGNQNTNQGEYMITTPNDALFISKHSIKGFNPAKAVNMGIDPITAFAIQEQLKTVYGLSDSGKKDTTSNNLPVEKIRKAMGGSTVEGLLSPTTNMPNLSLDPMAPISTGVAYAATNNVTPTTESTIPTKAKLGTNLRNKRGTGGWSNFINNGGANYLSAGANVLGNIGGALISTAGNNAANRTIASANNQAASLIANAYDQMKGIDMNLLNKEDYQAAHAMAAVRAPIVNTAPQRAMAERSLQRRLSQINKNSLSGAAAQDRASTAETNFIDTMNQIYAQGEAQKENIKQANAKLISETSAKNAALDVEANKQYAQNKLALLQYNNQLDNAKISGKASAYANALTGNAAQTATTLQTNGNSWANAINNSSNSIANTVSTLEKQRIDTNNAYAGASMEAQVNAAIANGDINRMQNLFGSFRNSTNPTQKEYAKRLAEALDYSWYTAPPVKGTSFVSSDKLTTPPTLTRSMLGI